MEKLGSRKIKINALGVHYADCVDLNYPGARIGAMMACASICFKPSSPSFFAAGKVECSSGSIQSWCDTCADCARIWNIAIRRAEGVSWRSQEVVHKPFDDFPTFAEHKSNHRFTLRAVVRVVLSSTV
jgi:hypothetical protein